MNHLRIILFALISISLASCGVTSRTTGSSASPSKTVKKDRSVRTVNAIETGEASWYGPDFHGRKTANGETYDMDGLTAAHRTLPFNTKVLVENLDNGKTVEVRINDRGPFAKDRIIDLSRGAARQVDMIGPGTARVRIYLMNGETLNTANIKQPQYTVQLGSFETRALAEEQSKKIRSSYVQEVSVNGKTFYRIYFGDFQDPKIALEAQKRLEGLGHNGFVKQLENN
jgi:rare lipoprotein A